MKVKVVTYHGANSDVSGVYEGHATTEQIRKDCLKQFSGGEISLSIQDDNTILVLCDEEETEEYFAIEEFCIAMVTG